MTRPWEPHRDGQGAGGSGATTLGGAAAAAGGGAAGGAAPPMIARVFDRGGEVSASAEDPVNDVGAWELGMGGGHMGVDPYAFIDALRAALPQVTLWRKPVKGAKGAKGAKAAAKGVKGAAKGAGKANVVGDGKGMFREDEEYGSYDELVAGLEAKKAKVEKARQTATPTAPTATTAATASTAAAASASALLVPATSPSLAAAAAATAKASAKASAGGVADSGEDGEDREDGGAGEEDDDEDEEEVEPTRLTFKNDSDAVIVIKWHNTDTGSNVEMVRIPGKGKRTMETFAGNEWLIFEEDGTTMIQKIVVDKVRKRVRGRGERRAREEDIGDGLGETGGEGVAVRWGGVGKGWSWWLRCV